MVQSFFGLFVALDDQSETFTVNHTDPTTGRNGSFAAGAPKFAGHLHRATIEYLSLGLTGLTDQILKILQGSGVKCLHAFADYKP
jgi:hypothetical protein